jgi:hypothetical protein
MVWNTVDYLGTLPANLEAAFESAIQTPNQIPGLISYLVHGLLSPDPEVGLLGKLLNNVVDPFTWLPGLSDLPRLPLWVWRTRSATSSPA